MRRSHWWIGCLAMVLGVGGCDQEPETPTLTRTGQQVPIFREFRGQQGPIAERSFLVIQRPETWQALWGTLPAPAVDFTRYSVLGALLGQQPTGNYAVVITEVRTSGERTDVYVAEERPTPGTTPPAGVTTPYHLVVVPKLATPVTFVLEGGGTVPIAIQDEYLGPTSAVETAQTAVLRDAASWQQFWTAVLGATTPAPAIDFDRQMAVAVLIGRRPTAGYSVLITGVDPGPERLAVNYRVRAPAPGDPVAQVITAPYAVAIIPTSPQPIAFRNVTPLVTASAP
jgi:hypothetical protein